MQFATYDQWCENQVLTALESGEPVQLKCSECQGDGQVECNMGHEHDCGECDGLGYIETNEHDELTAVLKNFKPRKSDYFESMINTFKLYSSSVNKPLIDVIGPFIKYWNIEKWKY